jgi:hypothetical protein
MFTLLEDLRGGLRILRRSPGLTLTAVIILSLGIAAKRTHEFGIRIALGARSRHVFSTMLRQGMTLTLAGLGAGTLGAGVVLKVSAAFLPKLRTDDTAIFGGAILLLALVGFLASYLPARRATKVDAWRRRSDRADRRRWSHVREDPEERNAEGLSGPSAWYAHHERGPDQRRPAGVL